MDTSPLVNVNVLLTKLTMNSHGIEGEARHFYCYPSSNGAFHSPQGLRALYFALRERGSHGRCTSLWGSLFGLVEACWFSVNLPVDPEECTIKAVSLSVAVGSLQ